MKKLTRASWYKNWFDSPYYNLLYGNRNEEEASLFIERIVNVLNIFPKARILDLACGKGRHAKFLAAKDFEVVGLDISNASIQYAKQFEQADNLSFYLHDMRHQHYSEVFDYVFNFFTSFGYFETVQEHIQSLQHIATALRQDGYFILDFFNSNLVEKQLPSNKVIQRGDIDFVIKKQKQGEFVVKHIAFKDREQKYSFEESVRLFHLNDFKQLFNMVGLKIVAQYGNYNLDDFVLEESPRLILVAQKI